MDVSCLKFYTNRNRNVESTSKIYAIKQSNDFIESMFNKL